MTQSENPNFLDLLATVYPKIGDSGEAVDVLLNHCASLILDPDHGPRANDSKMALRAFGLLNPNNRARQLSGSKGASRVRSALVQAVTPWKAGSSANPQTSGWGWAALQMATIQNDAQTVRTLLSHPQAPPAREINDREFTYEIDGVTNQNKLSGKSNLPGALMRASVVADTPDLLGETVRALIDAGVDFNVPIGEGLKLPLAYCRFPSVFTAMVENGVRVDAPDSDGTSALTLAFAGIHPAQHPHMIATCNILVQTQPAVVEHMQKIWPQLVEAWGKQLAGSRNQHALSSELSGVVDLARLVGMPLGSKREGEPNLFASWARAKLAMVHKSSSDYRDIRRFPEWQDITKGMDIPNKWTGAIEAGIPNGAWGMLVAAQNEDYRKNKSFSREKATNFAANQSDDFWHGALRLFEKLRMEPCVWQAVQVLQPSIPKAMINDFRTAALNGFIENREQGLEQSLGGYDEVSVLMNVATQCLKPIAKGATEIYNPQMVNLALRAHILNGMRPALAMQSLEQMAANHPSLVDADGIRKSLALAGDRVEPEAISRIEAALLAIVAPQVRTSNRSGPRL